MITALDHIVLLCPNLDDGIAAYSTVLGLAPIWQTEGDESASALFKLRNTALELIAPKGVGEHAQKLRNMTKDGAALTSLAYCSDDIAEDHRVMTRRGLAPLSIVESEASDSRSGVHKRWQSFRIPDAEMAGIKSFVLQGDLPGKCTYQPEGIGAVGKLDHLVINTPNPDRTVATYGARLGLRFALDRTTEAWNTRFLFFRLGDLTLEIIHRLGETPNAAAADSLWGITWQTDNLEAAHQRLADAGVVLSEIRTGRKPGSRVFTVKSNTLGIPTLFIHHAQA